MPLLAPLLMHFDLSGPANIIYRAYSATCHQLPSRSYFLWGQQVAVCHRDLAIWMTMFIGGVFFSLLRQRLKPLPFHWWVLFVIPIGLDGGTQLIGSVFNLLPAWLLLAFGLFVALGLSLLIFKKGSGRWQFLFFVWCFPLGIFFVYVNGPRLSTWYLRSITGLIFALGNLWLALPMLQQEFVRIRQDLTVRLDSIEGDQNAYSDFGT